MGKREVNKQVETAPVKGGKKSRNAKRRFCFFYYSRGNYSSFAFLAMPFFSATASTSSFVQRA